ncbi:MAG TPA: Gfo/Idh/MocA family oxidoreductase [Candidatus Hydrogenedentes bacterium]|nr:Gfo/Idh/MocA family oxidoreductase [Candidatus Hydrogenedentota bacterium]
MSTSASRREFLKSSATASALAFASVHAKAQQNASSSANAQITLGCIGVGFHGIGWNLKAFLEIPDARVLAVCDVFKSRQEKARAMVNAAYENSDCAMYTDFREILARKDIDAVVISTPDHWHVLMSVMAARAGKDVFCEKPTLNVSQGQVLIEEMTRTGVVYQGGIEDRSVDQYYRIAEIARNGAIGKVQRILVTLPEGVVFDKEQEAPVPEGLDYDLWLGPAPFTPYTSSKLGAQEWRNVWDYSGGKLTDWGAHMIDTAQVAIFEEHGGPLEIDGTGEFPKDALSTTATKYEIHYRYKNDVEMIVKSGGEGIRIEGTDGWIECPQWRAPLAASKAEILEAVFSADESKMWPKPPTEHVEFIQAVKDRAKPIYTPTAIHRLSTTMHLGNISMRLGRKLNWDPVKEMIANDDEATALLSCPMRAPWTFDLAG